SGSAVPNAARIVPVAVWLTLRRAPTHSTPFTKNLQDRQMRTAEPKNWNRVSVICVSSGLGYGPMTSVSSPSLWTDADANGLAKPRTTACRSRHAEDGKCVGANPSPIEGGYSPMTGAQVGGGRSGFKTHAA